MAQSGLVFKSHDQPKFPEGSHNSWHSHFYPTQVRYFICFVCRHSALLKSLFPITRGCPNTDSPKKFGLSYPYSTATRGNFFSCNPTVPKVVGRGWLRSPLCNLLISDISHNKSCLLKWKPGRQKLFLLFRCLPENSAAEYFCAAPKASPETFHVSLYTSSSLSSSFYLHI